MWTARNHGYFHFLSFSTFAINIHTSLQLSSTRRVPAIDNECVTDHEACAGAAQPENG